MRIIISIFILASALTNSFGQIKSQYEIIGIAKGLRDNTILYLDFTDEDDKIIDSTSVVGEKFTFKGQLKSETVNAIIRTRNYSDYKFFWLENAAVTFNTEKGKFRDADITGSKTQDEQNGLNQLLKRVSEKEKTNREKQFVREHPNSIISAYILSVYSSTWGRDTTTVLFNKLSDELKNSFYGENIYNFISFNKDIKIGSRYVDFSQEDTEKELVRLSDFTDKIVLLEFWGSWCGPCRESNQELVKIYNEFKGKGFGIFGVGAETKREVWLQAIQKDKLTWTNVTDLKGDKNMAALIYGVSYYPTNFLIDKTGTIIARDLMGDNLRNKLKELLDK
jgi:thiol-disulfide isomerase/thioredoxin